MWLTSSASTKHVADQTSEEGVTGDRGPQVSGGCAGRLRRRKHGTRDLKCDRLTIKLPSTPMCMNLDGLFTPETKLAAVARMLVNPAPTDHSKAIAPETSPPAPKNAAPNHPAAPVAPADWAAANSEPAPTLPIYSKDAGKKQCYANLPHIASVPLFALQNCTPGARCARLSRCGSR